MNRRYLPETHDPILKEMNTKWRRTDQEIADEMGFDKSTIGEQRRRLGLPINSRPKGIQSPTEKSGYTPTEPVNPVKVAQRWLGNRLTEKQGAFWLDSRPANLDAVMRETNRMLMANGIEQVGIDRWRVTE